MSTRAKRAARGLGAAAFATLTASASHGIADGHSPSLLAITVAFVFATLVCIALAGRRMATWRLAVAVAISQGAFHLGFIALAPGEAVIGGGHHATMTMLSTAEHVHTGPAMWAAHAVAAVLTVLALRFGEGGLLTLVRLATAVMRALVSAVVPVSTHPARSEPIGAADLPRPALLARRILLFRGPPAHV